MKNLIILWYAFPYPFRDEDDESDDTRQRNAQHDLAVVAVELLPLGELCRHRVWHLNGVRLDEGVNNLGKPVTIPDFPVFDSHGVILDDGDGAIILLDIYTVMDIVVFVFRMDGFYRNILYGLAGCQQEQCDDIYQMLHITSVL